MKRSDQSSRRQFLKTTAAAGAAVTVSLDLARSAHAAGNDVLKLALVDVVVVAQARRSRH